MLRVMASGQVYRTNKHKKLCPGLMCMASLDYRMLKGEHLRCLAGRVRLAKPGKHPVQATSSRVQQMAPAGRWMVQPKPRGRQAGSPLACLRWKQMTAVVSLTRYLPGSRWLPDNDGDF